MKGKTKSDTVIDVLAGQNTAVSDIQNTSTQTLLCRPPGQLIRRAWKRRRSQRDLAKRRERQISHISHSTPSKSNSFGNTRCSGITGGWDSGGLGSNGDWERLDWSSASTRGGLEGGLDVTSTPTWLPTGGVAGRLDWSSSNAGTRGVWGGDYDWSKSSTRGAGAWLGKTENDWSTLSTGGVGAGVDKIETQLGNWEDDSNLNNQHLLSPPYLPGQVTQSSPVFCDGCHSWGNLLAVTVSQTRGM